MSIMVISFKRAFVGRCTRDITRMRQPSGRGIWEELKSNFVAQSGSRVQLLSLRFAFDFFAVVAQFGLSISKQVAKIYRRFAVRSCDLRSFHSCCHSGCSKEVRFVGQEVF